MKQQQQQQNSSKFDLKSLIHQHSLFLDNLIELIPARFYLPVDDNEKPWFQGLSKVAKASAKKESRQNIKKARRVRLDPQKASTTLDLLIKNIHDEKTNQEIEFEAVDKSVTYEELRERLHRKIDELRLKRNPGETETPRMEKRRGIREGKRKRDDEFVKPEDDKARKIEEQVDKATERLSFSHVKIGNEDENGRKWKKKKLSKLQTLEQAKKLDQDKKDPNKGEKITWGVATSRAAGVKVHDDPKLIKKSIKKEKKRHEKNVDKWKERVESKDKVRMEKQQNRSGNIADRIHDKKMRRIAKREKKLMRPGFEGRKEGFITKT